MNSRLLGAEDRIDELLRRLAEAESRITYLEQTTAQQWSGYGGAGGSVSSGYWCQSPGFTAASGSWPTLTPVTGTADVYSDIGGTMTLFQSGATIRWWYKDPSTAGKLVALVRAADGAWDAILDSCTGV